MICTYYLSDGVSMVTETSGTRTGTLDSEYKNIGIIPIYFVFHCPLGPLNLPGLRRQTLIRGQFVKYYNYSLLNKCIPKFSV